MAGLAIRSERRELNPALANIGELKNVIFHSVLRENGFSDVVNTPGEVAGNKNACRISVSYLHIADRNFWRVAACVCDAGFNEASAMVDDVTTRIDRLQFF